jgi:hypothetical protein
LTGRYKIVGYLDPSFSQKTYAIRYFWQDLFELIEKLQKLPTEPTYVFLGQVQVKLIHQSIHNFWNFPVEIDQFLNAYSPDRKSPSEIINLILLADPKKLEENGF